MIGADHVTGIVRMLVEGGHTACAPYADRQRTFWFHDDLPFHMVNMSECGNRVLTSVGMVSHWLGEMPIAVLSETIHMRRYDLCRHRNRDRLWTMTIHEQVFSGKSEVRYARAAFEGDEEQAVEDFMEAIMRM